MKKSRTKKSYWKEIKPIKRKEKLLFTTDLFKTGLSRPTGRQNVKKKLAAFRKLKDRKFLVFEGYRITKKRKKIFIKDTISIPWNVNQKNLFGKRFYGYIWDNMRADFSINDTPQLLKYVKTHKGKLTVKVKMLVIKKPRRNKK